MSPEKIIEFLETTGNLTINTSGEDLTDFPEKFEECSECGGCGYVMEGRLYPTGHTEVNVECHKCEGNGVVEIQEPNYSIF